MPKQRRVAVKLDLEWPYKRHTGIFSGVQKYALEKDWQLTVDEFIEEKFTTTTNPQACDGVISRASLKLAQRAARVNVPVVNVWISSPVANRLPTVIADCTVAGQLRAEHLLSRGLRRFAALVLDHDRAEDTELQAFTAVLAAAGCQCNVEVISQAGSYTAKEWLKREKIIARWLDTWELPIGVFIGSEAVGRNVAQDCRNRGWRVPEDVAIITGRNEPTFCEGLRPTLSSIEFGFERIGYEAARLLGRLMNGEAPPEKPILVPPDGIVVRESTDFYSVDDEIIAAALKFISTNCHREIGQDDVARAVATETRTLQRRFQKYLNRPIVSEIRRVRIERAKRELAQGSRSMAEIAHDVGFGDAMRMYEVFRRELGVTPSQYRHERQLPQ